MDAIDIPHDKTAGSHLFERLVFFSDAIFAISMTLLFLDLRTDPKLSTAQNLVAMVPNFEGVFISFFVIGLYWMAHHRLFGTLRREDAPLRNVNLLFLASVAFLPFATKLIVEQPLDTVAVSFYAMSAATVGLLMIAVAVIARRADLLNPGETRWHTVRIVIHLIPAPAVFLCSIVLAQYQPHWAARSWILIWPLVYVVRRIGDHLVERRTPDPATD